MSANLCQRMMKLRERVLRDGVSEFAVFGPDNRRLALSRRLGTWEDANNTARDAAARFVGREFRVEERKWLDGVCAVSRCRHWNFHFVHMVSA